MITQILATLKILILAVILSLGLSYVYAWTAPTANPPLGNVSAPINTSATDQAKIGKLTVGGLDAGSKTISTTGFLSGGEVLTSKITFTDNTFMTTAPAGAPVGTILAYAGATAPSGFLLCDGSAVSRTTYPALYSLLNSGTDQNLGAVTITTASPGRATLATTAWSPAVNDVIYFTTTGTLPGGITANTRYFIVNTVFFPGRYFTFSATRNGPGITTSGTQSGIHTLHETTYTSPFGIGDGSTTFNLPDLRGEFIRGLDKGRGIDPGRVLGSSQVDMLESHRHTVPLGVRADNLGNGSWASTGAVYAGNTTNSALNGGTETRPRNVSLNYIIKY